MQKLLILTRLSKPWHVAQHSQSPLMDALGPVPPIFSGLRTSSASSPDLGALNGLVPDAALPGSEISNAFLL